MRILMCRPDYYGIEYEINPWMNIKFKADHSEALRQWEELYKTLLACGANISLVQPIKGLPDMTFTANAGLYFQNKLILSHFKYKERQGETAFFKQWFQENDFQVIETQGLPFFEGAGDALGAGNRLFAGFGFRTERKFYARTKLFKHDELIYCELVDPYFYHIDTCFCPLTGDLAIWYPAAFSSESQHSIQNNIKLIEVPFKEAKLFACNAVVIEDQVILPNNCPTLSKALNQHGFKTYACEMTEFMKAGGACKCLTLRID